MNVRKSWRMFGGERGSKQALRNNGHKRIPWGRQLQVEALEDRLAPAVADLTFRGAVETVNGAIFRQADPQPTGTGFIDSFLRIQKNGVEQGYNTDFRPVQFDEKQDHTFTHALRLSDVPVVNVNGIRYSEFLLDVNESSPRSLISLDDLRLYVSNSNTLTGYDAGTKKLAGLTAVYDLDAGGDNWIKLDYRLNSGSGSGDMFALIPRSLFGSDESKFVYLYSKFGLNHDADDGPTTADAGFEEWAVAAGPVSPPECPPSDVIAFTAANVGEGNKGTTFRPAGQSLVLTARSRVDATRPLDADAAGQVGTIYIDPLGAGVQNTGGGGSKGISGGGGDQDEELIVTFDTPVRADSIQIRLADLELGNGVGDGDDPIIFVHLAGGGFVTVGENEIQGAFVSTGSKEGTVDFSKFSSLADDAAVDFFQVRETRGHIFVKALASTFPQCPDARIGLTPPNATNEVNDTHTITALVEQNSGSGFVAAPNGTVVVFSLLNNTAGAVFVPDNLDSNNDGVPGNDCVITNNQGTCIIQITSSGAGSVEIRGTTTLTLAGASVTRTTGTTGNGPDVSKRFVDAQIDLSPLTATNRINEAHTITATVQQNTGSGFAAAPNGTVVSFSLLNNSAGAAFLPDATDSNGDGNTGNDCVVSNGLGTCTIQINSSSAGSVDIRGTTTFTVAGISVTRTTGSGGLNSPDANKIYGARPNAEIDLSPLIAVNQVGDPHRITATVLVDDGLVAGQGGDGVTGFTAAPNGTVVVFNLLNNTIGAEFVTDNLDSNSDGIAGNDCVVTNGQGTCFVTITSISSGSVTIRGTTTVTVGGQTLTRSTGTTGNSADAVKRYVDAQIDLTPLTATNRVGEAHTITATVQQNTGSGFGPAPNGTVVVFSLLKNNAGAAFVADAADSNSDGITGNDCVITNSLGTCTIQINSNNPGSVDIRGTTTFQVGGLNVTRTTGTGGLNSPDANKVYVNVADAKIALSPLLAVNEVGDAHRVTATVLVDDGIPAGGGGDGVNGFTAAPNGTVVVFSLLNNTIGAQFVADNLDSNGDGIPGNDCVVTNGQGTCFIEIVSNSPGIVTIRGTTTVIVAGQTLTRSTGTTGNTADAVKRYVDAQIDLSPLTATNRVGEAHTITATVQQDTGSSFGPAPNGTVVVFSLLNNSAGVDFLPDATDSNGDGITGNDCVITNGLGTCTIQINSNSPGSVDIRGTTTFTIEGISLTRTTGSGGLNSPDANKVYIAAVDAKIVLSPLVATNKVGDPHQVTATVLVDDGIPAGGGGDGVSGFTAAPDGTVVVFSLLNNNAGAAFAPDAADSDGDGIAGNDCLVSNGQGTCFVTITSNSAGSVTIRGSTTVTVGGQTLTRTTNTTGNSTDAVKRYVDARITIGPDGRNRVNVAHTFTLVLERHLGNGTGFQRFAGQTVSASVISGTCTFVGPNSGLTNSNGEFQVTINSSIVQTCVVEASFNGEIVPGDTATAANRTSDPDGTKVYFNDIGIVSGSVYEDRNNNGVRNLNERGIPGVTVNLRCVIPGSPSAFSAQTTTRTDGSYAFRNLPAGADCSVTEQPQTQFPLNRYRDGKETKGNIVALPNSIGTDVIEDIIVAAGQETRHNNFGELPRMDLRITKTDGRETAAPGAFDVYIIQATNGGPFAVQNALVRDVLPRSLLNPTWTCVATSGSNCDADNGSGDINTTVDLLVGGTATFRVTGVINPAARGTLVNRACVATTVGGLTDNNPTNNCDTDRTDLLPNISGIVYHDRDNDGVKDSPEEGIGGVTVQLVLGSTVVRTTTTRSNGTYEFRAVPPGTYTVVEPTQPSGFLDGKETRGNIVSLGNSTIGTDRITGITVVAAGQDVRHNNFGEIRPASVSGFVYVDADANGVFEPNRTDLAEPDTALGGVRVTLTGTDDLGTAVNTSVQSTIDNGYRFSGLRPGTYTITETQPPEFLDGSDNLGTINGVVRGTIPANDQFALPLRSAENGVNYNFGELRGPVRGGRLSGFVHVDQNDNGIKETGEEIIPGTRIILTGTDVDGRQIRLEDTTDARGFYEFFVDPGSYVITELQPSGFIDGKDTIGSLGGVVSNDRFSSIVVPDTGADIRGVNYNFGERRQSEFNKCDFFAIQDC